MSTESGALLLNRSAGCSVSMTVERWRMVDDGLVGNGLASARYAAGTMLMMAKRATMFLSAEVEK